MIEIKGLNKSFEGGIKAVNELNLTIADNQVFGLIGTNGAGKSALMRMMSGVLKADSGEIKIDSEYVYENPMVKKQIFFIPDEAYFFQWADANAMRDYYAGIYTDFDSERFDKLTSEFGLKKENKIITYSKGMKKQLSLIMGLCAKTKYLYCDETFDGLDPVMRQAAKSLLAKEIDERDFTPVITSHNLRELEDICEHVGLLHQGGVLLSKDLDDMKLNLQKVQCVFADESRRGDFEKNLDILIHEERGRLHTYTLRGERPQIESIFANEEMVFFENLSLTLEEIFICETEVAGYDVRKLIAG